MYNQDPPCLSFSRGIITVAKTNNFKILSVIKCRMIFEFLFLGNYSLVLLTKSFFKDYNYNSVIYHCYIGGV